MVDLLTELNENNKAMVTEVRDNSKAQVEALKGQQTALEGQKKSLDDGFDRIATLLAASANATVKAQAMQSGAGTKTETGGVAFNPFTASVSALGGDKLRVTFPKTAELIADAKVEMYQCKFTFLKDGKLDTKQVRACVHAHVHVCPPTAAACTRPAVLGGLGLCLILLRVYVHVRENCVHACGSAQRAVAACLARVSWRAASIATGADARPC